MKNIAKLYDQHSIMLVPLVDEIRKNVKKGDIVIDLGCGSGVYIKLLENKVGENGKLIGTDIDNEMIKFCKNSFRGKNINFKKIPAEKLSSIKVKADAVFSSLVLHFTNVKKSLAEIKKVLRPAGKLIFAVPLYRSGIEIFDNEDSKKFRSKFVENLKTELKINNIKAKISLDYANSREKFFKQVVQKNKLKILNWEKSSLEKANLKVLLEYFKIPLRSEKLLKIPFSVRYKILKTALIKTFREFPNFKSNRYYLIGVAEKKLKRKC